jgi:hypothetical protein
MAFLSDSADELVRATSSVLESHYPDERASFVAALAVLVIGQYLSQDDEPGARQMMSELLVAFKSMTDQMLNPTH